VSNAAEGAETLRQRKPWTDNGKVSAADPTVNSVDDRAAEDALLRARDGDAAAFAQIYRLHQPAVLRYLRVMVPSEAEDVASETWLQAVRDFHRFRGNAAGLRAWLVTIARHRALDALRARRRRPADAWDPAALPDRAAPEDTEALTAESLATRRALALIARLPTEQAEAVLLRVVVGLDAPAAAAVLGKRAGAVRMATSRGLARLEQLISEPAGDSGVTDRDAATLKEVR
jgi:RNA polymerase sigma-70 factor (ECF subfamily)